MRTVLPPSSLNPLYALLWRDSGISLPFHCITPTCLPHHPAPNLYALPSNILPASAPPSFFLFAAHAPHTHCHLPLPPCRRQWRGRQAGRVAQDRTEGVDRDRRRDRTGAWGRHFAMLRAARTQHTHTVTFTFSMLFYLAFPPTLLSAMPLSLQTSTCIPCPQHLLCLSAAGSSYSL